MSSHDRTNEHDTIAMDAPALPAQIVHLDACQLQPGDQLPPQAALHGSRWQREGFTVGPRHEDVRADLPIRSGRVLLFGADGSMLALPREAVVAVRRA